MFLLVFDGLYYYVIEVFYFGYQTNTFLFRFINRITILPSVVNVYVPKDRVTNLHQGYGFVEFRSEEDADYVSLLFCEVIVYLLYFL